jgi:hypothetical protein
VFASCCFWHRCQRKSSRFGRKCEGQKLKSSSRANHDRGSPELLRVADTLGHAAHEGPESKKDFEGTINARLIQSAPQTHKINSTSCLRYYFARASASTEDCLPPQLPALIWQQSSIAIRPSGCPVRVAPDRSCVSSKQAVFAVIPFVGVFWLRFQPRDEPIKSVVLSMPVGTAKHWKFLSANKRTGIAHECSDGRCGVLLVPCLIFSSEISTSRSSRHRCNRVISSAA